ncbi:hypothetical protein [Chitinilyticum litopenaei]|uniref:hypothetical protein n=1 Tax=Chitinilyticum litopenaei TaxID=1121276 RepID=UPI0011846E43|nr:hypothetical protein [Chitinilyticum litopenaei]
MEIDQKHFAIRAFIQTPSICTGTGVFFIEGVAMDHTRYNRWKRASFALIQIEPFLATTLQQLGKIDASLYEKDHRYREIRERNNATTEEWNELNDSMTMAYLWVLGAYEVIRTIDQRFRELGLHASGQYQQSTKVKRSFERVRIPLAKLEPPRKHNTDKGFAYPALNAAHGLGWIVADDVIISRGELSTQLLEFLENLNPANSV